MKNIGNKPFMLICDFDGTISVKDVNDSIFKHFGNADTREIESQYRNSMIGVRESLENQYDIIKIDEDTFTEYVNRYMEIDRTFFELLDYAKEEDIEVAILSGGFINYIKILFDKYNHKLDIPVFSNRLDVCDGIMYAQYGEVPECRKEYGPCGICKLEYLSKYKEKYTILYAGDGFTDRCAAEIADVVFAKDDLATYCNSNNIKYISYNDFSVIKNYIKNNLLP